MATLRLLAYETIGSNAKHERSSWQVALDPRFKYIVDQSIDDPVNLTSWTTPLPKRPEHKEFGEDVEEFYTDEVALYARVRLQIGNVKTGWWEIPCRSQLYQEYDVTEENTQTIKSNSVELGMVTNEQLVPPVWEYPEDNESLDEMVEVKYCFDCRRSSVFTVNLCRWCGGTDFTLTQDSLDIIPPYVEQPEEPNLEEPDFDSDPIVEDTTTEEELDDTIIEDDLDMDTLTEEGEITDNETD